MSVKTDRIQSSIDKWEGKVRQDVLNKKKIDYVRKYWNECGYCKIVNMVCDLCSLYKTKDSLLKIRYCEDNFSIASNALYYAKYTNYDKSLKNIDILLKKMKQDLKQAKKEEKKKQCPFDKPTIHVNKRYGEYDIEVEVVCEYLDDDTWECSQEVCPYFEKKEGL